MAPSLGAPNVRGRLLKVTGPYFWMTNDERETVGMFS